MKQTAVLLFLLFSSSLIFSQHLNTRSFFYSYFDVTEKSDHFFEAGLRDVEGDNYSDTDMFLQGGFSPTDRVSFNAKLDFYGEAFNFDEALFILVARINAYNTDRTKIALGPYVEVSEGDLGAFAAFKHVIQDGVTLKSKFAVVYDDGEFEENEIILGGSLIFTTSRALDILAELNYKSGMYGYGENLILSSGLEFFASRLVSLRGSFGYNVLEDEPDFYIKAGVNFMF